jgi:hypothetical protein
MKRAILALSLWCGLLYATATGAFAQSAPPDPATNLGQDFEAFSILHKHVFEDIQALSLLAQQQRKQIDDLTKQLSDAKKPTADAPPATPPSPK